MSDKAFIGIKRRNRTKSKKPKEEKKKLGRKKKMTLKKENIQKFLMII